MASNPNTSPQDNLTLQRALRLSSTAMVAFVGAGGKSAAMFQLAREYGRALLTSSTHLGGGQAKLADCSLPFDEAAIQRALEKGGTCLVTGGLEPESGKLAGLSLEQITRLAALAHAAGVPLLVEADGARQKALKAPAAHEPALPPGAEVALVCAGMSALNQPLTEAIVHRAQLFSEISGLGAGESIRPPALLKALIDPQGGLKSIPAGVRPILLLNQADTPELQSGAAQIALQAIGGQPAAPPKHAFGAVLIASLHGKKIFAVHEPIAAVVLAAGSAARFGGPKQLLHFAGQPFVRRVAQTALQAGLWPVTVVTGAYAAEVEAALAGLPVQIAHNEAWREGQAASIRAGVKTLWPWQPGGTLFLLADQPQVTVEVIRALVEHHARRLDAVTAPYVFDQRANPVLFDAVTFDALSGLTGDVGGRAIFGQFSPRYLTWYDRQLLLDVDKPEDYERLLG